MTGNDIPDRDNVVRYVGGRYIADGRVTGDAFCLTSGRDRLSVNWLEYFAGLSKPAQLSEIRKLSRLTMGINGLPQDDSAESNLIRDRIAECVTEMHPAREG